MRSIRLLLGVISLALAPAVSAQTANPIRFIVSAAAGGSIDVYARIIAEHMATTLKRPIVAEARAGANGNIAAQVVLDSPADGATVLVGTQSTIEINPHTYKNLRWKVSDFVPVIKGIDTVLVLVAHPSIPSGSFKEWAEWAKANKGSLVYANYGNGTLSHFLGYQLGDRLGLGYSQVSYRGSAPQMVDLLAGHVKFGFTQLQGAVEPAKSRLLNVLVLSSAGRTPLLPDLPTLAEVGLSDLTATAWFGLLVREGTPAPVLAEIEAAAIAAHADRSVRAKLEEQGYIVNGQIGAAFKQSIAEQGERWARIVKATGFSGE